MKLNPILTALSAATLGFLIGLSFPVQIAPQLPCYVLSWSGGGGDAASNVLGRLSWVPFVVSNNNNNSSGTAAAAAAAAEVMNQNKTTITASSDQVVTSSTASVAAAAPKLPPTGAERLPPNIVVSESDLHLRRLWGEPREDTPVRKYLLTLTVGYTEKANVNATVSKFSDDFDVMLFHYDGRTTEWDEEFPWSQSAIHVSARKQAKWWYAKRFLHPRVVAPYDYVFLWDEDLDVTFFDADEYVRLVTKHGLAISQPALDFARGKKSYEITARRSSGVEVHLNTTGGPGNCSDVHQRPCSGFVEVMAPVFSREAWACAWHMVQNDLVHGWGLDVNFWRCVDEPERQIGVVDAQYVAHRAVPSLGRQGNPETGGGGKVRARAWREYSHFRARMTNADRAAQREAAAAAAATSPPRSK